MYLYNGKELNTDFGLDMLDYGARWYDPSIARFHTIDPLAEKFGFQTPYTYANNNPIKFIDFMGMNASECEGGDCPDPPKKSVYNKVRDTFTKVGEKLFGPKKKKEPKEEPKEDKQGGNHYSTDDQENQQGDLPEGDNPSYFDATVAKVTAFLSVNVFGTKGGEVTNMEGTYDDVVVGSESRILDSSGNPTGETVLNAAVSTNGDSLTTIITDKNGVVKKPVTVVPKGTTRGFFMKPRYDSLNVNPGVSVVNSRK